MKYVTGFTGGLGTGALLISILGVATLFWKTDLLAEWLKRDSGEVVTRRGREPAQRLARASAEYLDAIRAAGL